jgi:hypothetical protein
VPSHLFYGIMNATRALSDVDTLLWLLCCFPVTLQGAASTGASTQQQTTSAQPPAPLQNDPANEHTIKVRFNYNFRKTPSCAEKPALKTCVKQFVVYDVSGRTFKLFSIPVPDGARGLVKGIEGQSPRRIFLPGKHLIAVTAQNANGVESDVNAAKVAVKVSTVASSSPAK